MDLQNEEIISLENVHTIGVIMFGLLGDVFIRTPVLKALKELYPEAKVFVCVDSIGALVLENNLYCDEILVVNRSKKNRLQYYANKISTLVKIRARKPDLMVDLYNGGSSPMNVFLSSARYRLGYAHQKDKKLYNILSQYIPYSNGQIDSYNVQIISILQAISKKQFSIKPIYNIRDESREFIANYFLEKNIVSKEVYVINLGSGGEEKLLSLDIYAQLIGYIYKKYGYIPLIIQNPGQEYLQKNLVQLLEKTDVPYLALELLTLDEIAALIEKTLFFITPDTGLMHLAFALDAYVLTAFTYTNPKLVDLCSENFFPVFDSFAEENIHQVQDISFDMMRENLDRLITSLK
ncbi:MAG: glycosyltransferase family 9 protein [Campylobacterales bacterium]|nr:glycosyltransferase family 9 protein [Campylobacterales bacterium]